MLQLFHEKNRELLININGRLIHRDQAGVSPFDSSVQGGDAVWEGLRLYRGRIFKLVEHLDRLRSSALALAFQQIPTHEELIQEIRKTVAANRMHDGVHIRLTLTRGVKYTSGMDPRLNTVGPTLIVLAEHKPPVYDKSGISLITSSLRRPPPDCLDPKIHHCNLLTSILAKIEANVAGADDAVMLDQRGLIAETNATHIFLIEKLRGAEMAPGDDSALTPEHMRVITPRTVASPEGITRATVMDICRTEGIEAVERNLSLTELYRANEVFCTGTLGELAPVTKVDGRTISTGAPGPVTRRLSDAYRDMTETNGFSVCD